MRKAAETAPKEIVIPAIKLARMNVEIVGVTALLTHRFGDRAQKAMEDKQQAAAKVKKEPRQPDQEFQDAIYYTRDGKPGFPAAGIKKALVAAGGRFADETMTVLRGIISIRGDVLEINGSEPKMRTDTVRLSGGVSSLTYRPEFQEWSIVVPTVYNLGMISQSQVVNLFQIAGFSVGIGDWRPEKSGTFGQFTLGKVENMPWE